MQLGNPYIIFETALAGRLMFAYIFPQLEYPYISRTRFEAVSFLGFNQRFFPKTGNLSIRIRHFCLPLSSIALKQH